tara:strand:- start:4800 stop:5252 length:453 start_codon:yes stop_codon:yes gene_type:complete
LVIFIFFSYYATINIYTGKIMSIQINKSFNFIVYGEPASKANSRKIVHFGKRMGVIKSQKARDYEKNFAEQCPQLENLIETNVKVELIIYYASRRPDLDESVVLDCMQGKIYVNDRQVKQKIVYWGLDRNAPRTHIRISTLETCDLPSDF